MAFNYAHCNDPESILHMLIPQAEDPDIGNLECTMFKEKATIEDNVELELATEYLLRGNREEALLHLGRSLGGKWEDVFSCP